MNPQYQLEEILSNVGKTQGLSEAMLLSANDSLLDNKFAVIPLLQPCISVCHRQ